MTTGTDTTPSATATRPFLEVSGLARRFPARGGGTVTVFEHVDFTMDRGEFVCVIGHSGCGKSTILNILAGLDTASTGALVMDGHEISGPGLDRGVVFQNYSLLPWASALDNVIFGVRARHRSWSRAQIRAHALAHLAKVGLTGGAEHRKPSELSGGMRQRVSIARAFAIEPRLLLLDEPFGALDALTRGTIQDELIRIWSGTDQSVFMITHDVDEAILLADRILLMTNGPRARIAESVVIDIPRPRARDTILHDPAYYAIRNHLVEFLTRRSRELAGGDAADGATHPPASRTIRFARNPAEAGSSGPDGEIVPLIRAAR
ncbi:nitrate/sulfonate/bicarbonate ABC transporter ATP-binding protein [Tistrella bauzanensis]|uniref:Nitrate/sulfonate/bicarbonate ABC transporter ATP-binding protein n=1 Tax=Tistrella bauzanensis TaxID=657419 RepID=A0ABQ1IA47_9PROT|nr:ABC transporter ATP-binding protein [Tistrella bauzanensis]GGB31315.1 nitrate/sulfonate/bicarbonate ABC transporter ATP-binding protein [Tistrella bauzanensis]